MKRDLLLVLLLIVRVVTTVMWSRKLPANSADNMTDSSVETATTLPAETGRAFIDDSLPGWRSLGETDFVEVNGLPDTWQWRDGLLYSTGEPIGVFRTRDTFRNFEMVIEEGFRPTTDRFLLDKIREWR